MRFLVTVLALALCLCGQAWAESVGTLIKAADLKEQPFADAATVSKLPAEAALSVVRNQGAWSQVKTRDGQLGWVRLLNVAFGKTGEKETLEVRKTISSVGNVFRTGTKSNVATTGVKGLSKDDIKNSKPNFFEVKRLETYRAKPADVGKFATASNLVTRDVPEIAP